MNVLLNLESLAPPLTGVGRYSLEILRGVTESKEVSRVYSFVHYHWVDPSDFVVTNSSQTLVAGKRKFQAVKDIIKKIPYAFQLKNNLDDLFFYRQSKKLKNCLYHETNYVCRPFPGPKVVTVHDLSHIHYPEYHPRDRVEWLNRGLRKTLENAEQIITVSRYIKDELVAMMRLDPQRVKHIPLGVNPEYRVRTGSEALPVLEKYNIHNLRYVLVVGTLEPRKNLQGLLEAYSRLTAEMRREHPLVIVGARGWRRSHFQPQMAALASRGEVLPLGYVPESDLPFIYAGAHGLAFPSIYEGFGLPPLEAMACGVPVLAGRSSSIPEVVGDAALLADPRDPDRLGQGLHRLLTDSEFRRQAASQGPIRARGFTWERCLQETLQVYARALES
ncbi:MAG: glycosyltransferase family 4 protein [Desulfohalobiaceae bacterium]|nr:glycosyltransferase family 4 protein [Desulfohalobiaceae bacterium]